MTGCRLFLLLPILLLNLLLPGLPVTAASAAEREGRVSHVFDGDTLLVEGIGKVRLVGIDAPEREASHRDVFYRRWHIPPRKLRGIAVRARQFCSRSTRSGQVKVVLAEEPRDQYGRVLAYVYLPDGRLLNRLLLTKGLATVYRRFDFRMKEDFLRAEADARRNGRGLWETSGARKGSIHPLGLNQALAAGML